LKAIRRTDVAIVCMQDEPTASRLLLHLLASVLLLLTSVLLRRLTCTRCMRKDAGNCVILVPTESSIEPRVTGHMSSKWLLYGGRLIIMKPLTIPGG